MLFTGLNSFLMVSEFINPGYQTNEKKYLIFFVITKLLFVKRAKTNKFINENS